MHLTETVIIPKKQITTTLENILAVSLLFQMSQQRQVTLTVIDASGTRNYIECDVNMA
jgi:hypothetical protein